jgi:hypothetical protein
MEIFLSFQTTYLQSKGYLLSPAVSRKGEGDSVKVRIYSKGNTRAMADFTG